MNALILFSAVLIFIQPLWAEEPNNRTLVIGINQEYDSLHPHVISMAASRYLQYMINRTLVTMDDKSKWVPLLAEEIPTGKMVIEKNENGKKKKFVTWKIKSNANWSDDTPITCADFSYSLQVGKDPLVQVANKDVFDKIERIEFDKSKPKTCLFVYSDNSWTYYQLPDFFPLPAHQDQEIFKSSKNEKNAYSNNNIYSLNKATKAAFSGPYRIVDIKPGSHVVLETNQNFYGQLPYFTKIVLKIIPNNATFEAHIKSKTLDMIAPIGLTFDQGTDFNKRWSADPTSNHRVEFKEGANFEHITFNLDSKIFKDIRVRQALVQSINRDELTKIFFEGKQTVSNFYQSKTCPWFPKDTSKIKIYKYSAKEAEKLLDQAGWIKKPDGFRYNGETKLAFSFNTTASNVIRENVQVYMKNEWLKIGVDVQIKNYPARVLFGEIAKKRQFDGIIMHAWAAAPETAPSAYLSSKNVPSETNNWSGFNFGGWKNSQWDAELEKLNGTDTDTKRKSIVINMLDIYNKDLPDFPLYYKTEVAVVPKKMKNFKMTGHTYFETNQIEYWSY